MSARPLPVTTRGSEHQYVGDLVTLFQRHKLHCGEPQDVEALGLELRSNSNLRTDLFMLCTAISHMGEADLSPEQLLGLIVRAVGGPAVAATNGEAEVPPHARSAFIDSYLEWLTRDPQPRNTSSVPASDPEEEADPWHLPETPFMKAAALAYESGHGVGNHLPHESHRPISPDTAIGDLTLRELSEYLIDLERRVQRAESYLAPGPTPEVLPSAVKAPAESAIPPLRGPAPMPVFGPAQDLSSIGLLPAEAAAETVRQHPAVARPGPRLLARRAIVPVLVCLVLAASAGLAYRYLDNPSTETAVTTQAAAPNSNTQPAPISAQPLKDPQPAAFGPRLPSGTVPVRPPRPDQHVSVPGRASQPEATSTPGSTPSSNAALSPQSNGAQPAIVAAATPADAAKSAPIVRTAPPTAGATPPQIIEPYTQRGNSEPLLPRVDQPASLPIRAVATVPRPDLPAATAPAAPTTKPASSGTFVSVPSGLLMKNALATPAPTYPRRRIYIDGKITVRAVIAKDGRVTSAQAINGPEDLRSAAVQAMQQWRFKPYLVDGTPTGVVTFVNFNFRAQ